MWLFFKGIVHPKIVILSLITHPHVIPNLFIFRTQIKILWWNPRAFWPFIDSNAADTFKAQKGSKDIINISGSTQGYYSF